MAELDPWEAAAKSFGATEAGPTSDPWGAAARELGATGDIQDYQTRRKEYHERVKTDPAFRAQPASERAKMLFPDAGKQDAPAVTMKPGRGFMGSMEDEAAQGIKTASEGWHEAFNPTSYTRTLLGAPIANIVGGTVQQAFAPVTGLFNEYVSRPLGNLTRKAPVPDPETLAQQVEIASDVAGPSAISKGLGMLKAPLARALPLRSERLSKLEAEKNARLAANENQLADSTANIAADRQARLASLDKLAADAQTSAVRGQAERVQALPAARSAIRERTAAEIGAEQQRLAGAQAGVGQQAAESVAPAGPTRTNFNKRYTEVEKLADQIPTTPGNLNAASQKLMLEPGLARSGMATRPESTAARISRDLSQGDVEEIQSSVRLMLAEGASNKEIVDGLMVATRGDVTAGELLRTRKRFRAAQREAYAADRKNLGRQLGVLEDGIDADLAAAAKSDPRAKKLLRIANALDRDYSKQKTAEWYAEGVDQAFDPATGAWDRKRFTKWWDKHADSTDGDKHLKRLLGDKYDSTRGVVEAMQEATSLKIEKASAEAVRNLKRRMGTDLRAVNQREVELGKLAQQTEEGTAKRPGIVTANIKGREGIVTDAASKQAATEKASKESAKAIETEIAEKMEAITGQPYKGNFHRHYAMGSVILGVGSTAGGAMTENAALMYGGIATAGQGAFILMTHDAMVKLVNSAKGADLLGRAIRAAPGTGEAISASAAITNFAKQATSEPGEPRMPAPTGKPQIKNPDGTVSTEKTIGIESGGKHYNIPTIVNGKQLSKDEAIGQWRAGTNKPVGEFGSQTEADMAARARSERLSRELAPQDVQTKKSNLLQKYSIPSR